MASPFTGTSGGAITDAELVALEGVTAAADKVPYFDSATTATTATLTAAGRALIDDADASAQRTTLGLGTIATQAANNVSITGGSVTGITDITVADGGTGVSTMTTAYAPVCAGTTATGALQVASTGLSTSGYVLTSNGASALPSFQAPGGGGALVYLASATASASSSIQFTQLSSTYNNYLVVINNATASGTASMRMQFSSDGGSTYSSSAGDYYAQGMAAPSGSTLNNSGANAYLQLSATNSMDSNGRLNATITLMDTNNSSDIYKPYTGIVQDTFSNYTTLIGGGQKVGAAGINAIKFTLSSGTISTGTFRLFGIANS